MKKIFITISLLLSFLLGFSQTYYKAYLTEMYTYNEKTKEWDLYQKNSDVNITLVIEEEFLSVQAKSPSMYKIYTNSKEDITTKSFTGYRYKGRDLRHESPVVIDILRGNQDTFALISVINSGEGFNLRFFIKPIE